MTGGQAAVDAGTEVASLAVVVMANEVDLPRVSKASRVAVDRGEIFKWRDAMAARS